MEQGLKAAPSWTEMQANTDIFLAEHPDWTQEEAGMLRSLAWEQFRFQHKARQEKDA